ncbi:MAG: GMC oxidoreductase [Gemmatimonadaceae bacterium]
MSDATPDFVIIGSGFGGSVSAMRLREKGYSVLVLERGRRFADQDFARSTWNLRRYLWAPALRCFGILQISPFRDLFVLHGAGVGGGSLGYAQVLEQPGDEVFETAPWRTPHPWGPLLRPHYQVARRMLGVADNPRMGPADEVLHQIATGLGRGDSFRATTVGAFFGDPAQEGVEVPDPYFGGAGPARSGCIHCGGCMVGCRHNAKNTLVKNYLWFAEQWGAEVRPDALVVDVRPLAAGQPDGARYEVRYRRSSGILDRAARRQRARNVIVAAGALGTLRLLFRCRDLTQSLPRISPRLGDAVRTNSEAILGAMARDDRVDYSKGVAITSIFHADDVTTVEPVRYPAGSGSMRFLSGPLISGRGPLSRVAKSVWEIVRRPRDFLLTHVLPGWAERTTVILVMQHVDNTLRMRLGRSIWTGFRDGLVSSTEVEGEKIPATIPLGHEITRQFAAKIGGIPAGSINESLLGVPMTAHILGGCPCGARAEDGVVGADFQLHGYRGLYAIDGSIVPGNPGVNPSLTIAAMAEYAMSLVPNKPGAKGREPLRPASAADAPAPATPMSGSATAATAVEQPVVATWAPTVMVR